MNTLSHQRMQSFNWPALVMIVLGFWISASCALDFIVMPGLSAAGMMKASDFASAGYLIFGLFNRIELLCAALVFCGFLVFHRHHTLTHLRENFSIILAALLLIIPLVYTYILTPQMSSLGLSLNFFETLNPMTGTMIPLHGSYWLLEGLKLTLGATLLSWCYRDSCRLS